MSNLIINVPNERLLRMSFSEIEQEVNKYKTTDARMKSWKDIAIALGEINRHYSKKLPDSYILDLQRKMTLVRKKFHIRNMRAKSHKKPYPFPETIVEKWFGGETPNHDMGILTNKEKGIYNKRLII